MSKSSQTTEVLHKILSGLLLAAVLGLGKFYTDTKTELALLSLKVENLQDQLKQNHQTAQTILEEIKKLE